MDLAAFKSTLSAGVPPAGLSPALRALWWQGKGDWDAAHKVVQGHEGEAECDWVHAHLHRVEGDLSNAGYWYRHCGRKPAQEPLDVEWAAIAAALL